MELGSCSCLVEESFLVVSVFKGLLSPLGEKRRGSIGMSWGHPWPGSGGETLRSTCLPAQFCHNAAASAVTSCSGSPGEGGS